MTAVIMSAKPLFQAAKEQIAAEVRALAEEGYTPGLAAILTSNVPIDLETSQFYVSKKQKDCNEVGIYFEVHELQKVAEGSREKELLRLMARLNRRDDISGILIQKPLGICINEDRVFAEIEWSKDVDGLTPYNKGKLMSGYNLETDLLPCTAVGIIELLSHYNVDPKGKDVMIVGRSDLVGRPLRILLEQQDATVTCLHRRSRAKAERIRNADIVVCAAGRPPELYEVDSFRLTVDMIKEGAIVVNVGMRRDPASGNLRFDVDFDNVLEKASHITPNLGGVGLMTRTRLLQNLMTASRIQVSRVRP